jgi:hypothetical protein
MLEEFKIVDVFDALEPNLTALSLDNLENFMAQAAFKKDIDYSIALEDYMSLNKLKTDPNPPAETRDLRKPVPESELPETANNNS